MTQNADTISKRMRSCLGDFKASFETTSTERPNARANSFRRRTSPKIPNPAPRCTSTTISTSLASSSSPLATEPKMRHEGCRAHAAPTLVHEAPSNTSQAKGRRLMIHSRRSYSYQPRSQYPIFSTVADIISPTSEASSILRQNCTGDPQKTEG